MATIEENKIQLDKLEFDYKQHNHDSVNSKPVTTTSSDTGVRIRAVVGTTQSVGSGTTEDIEFNSEIYDSGSNFDTTTYIFTAPRLGYYSVRSSFRMAMPAGDDVTIYIYKNTSTLMTLASRQMAAAGTQTFDIQDILYLSVGDTIKLRVYQNTGVDRAITAAATQSYLTINEL